MNYFESQQKKNRSRRTTGTKNHKGGKGRESLGAVQSGLPHIGDWGKGDCGSSDAVTVYQAADGTFNAHCFSCGDDCQSTDEHGVPLALSNAGKSEQQQTASAPAQQQQEAAPSAAPAPAADYDVPPVADYDDYMMADQGASEVPADGSPASFDTAHGDTPSAIDPKDIPQLPHIAMRGISAEVLEQFHIYTEVDQITGEPRYCYTADYARGKPTGTYERRDLVNKGFIGIGDRKRRLDLWGLDSAPSKAHTLYVTEGVFDAMAGYEIIRRVYGTTNKGVAFASLVKGASSIESALDQNEGTLLRNFDVLVPAFDNDGPGSNARDLFVERFGEQSDIDYPEGCKDLNDVLAKLGGDNVALAAFADYLIGGGSTAVDDDIQGVDGMVDNLRRVRGHCYSTPWPELDEITGGVEEGTVTVIGAGPKVGKTTFNYNLIHHLLTAENVKVGLFDLETNTGRSLTRLAGVEAGKSFIRAGDETDYNDEIVALTSKFSGKLLSYSGVKDWPAIRKAISRMFYKHGVKVFIIDPLTVLTNGMAASSVNTLLQEMVDFMLKFADRNRVSFLCYTHVRTRPANGESYESGYFPQSTDYVGSRAFPQFSHFGISLARQTIDTPDELKNVIGIKVTLNRNFGDLGEVWCKYDPETTRLNSIPGGKPQPASEKQEKAARKEWENTVERTVETVVKGDEPKAKKGGLRRLAAGEEY